ncbi:L-seryl-tRNA(Ser) seleniumtransferase [Thermotomaculum hydrothermale]|uniref:L-seryl-tRNA(Sec) selenium transferase n=1 Tax=Thermotomaculum hydrothermale TaxID=981385 RepID=A0A7R6PWY6_9BACT|nr:L-seryl-tRNA(Sec) selenium transferase [Thermotomaculum hydrothermale]BBB32180.1 L-seryl-tRNA(Ser) seleniumtransferase [Thermotomaculum hydrothermale]
MKELFKQIPSVDQILSKKEIKDLIDKFGYPLVKDSVRKSIEKVRDEIKSGKLKEKIPEMVFELIPLKVEEVIKPSLKKVINGTGIIIHTNLGRAVLPESVADYIKSLSTCYSNLEYDIEKGKRGHRDSHAERLLSTFFNVEAATVVNNNAAAVMLIINTFAEGKEVVVSRGELIEIGGSFRIPEIMKKAGAKLVEVGTTNKTHLEDYANAINENTGLVLKVHPSNYRITGFTKSVPAKDIAKLCKQKGVVFAEDMGSGNIYDLSELGINDEPTVKESVNAGIDLISFSGDKLLGCVQAGIIIGKKEYIGRIRKNHLLRALRVDKITYAAIEKHMELLLREKYHEIPVYNMIFKQAEAIRKEIEEFISGFKLENSELEIVETSSKIGGGTTPEREIGSFALTFNLNKSPEEIEQYFRSREIPVIGRIKGERFLIDFRTILKKDIPILKNYVSQLLSH